MSTNARIGIKLEDGSILSAYHHWDGYPEWLGVFLKATLQHKRESCRVDRWWQYVILLFR